jgi:hypothetical protein
MSQLEGQTILLTPEFSAPISRISSLGTDLHHWPLTIWDESPRWCKCPPWPWGRGPEALQILAGQWLGKMLQPNWKERCCSLEPGYKELVKIFSICFTSLAEELWDIYSNFIFNVYRCPPLHLLTMAFISSSHSISLREPWVSLVLIIPNLLGATSLWQQAAVPLIQTWTEQGTWCSFGLKYINKETVCGKCRASGEGERVASCDKE